MNFLKFFRNEYWEDYFVKSDPKANTHMVTIDLKENTIHCDCEDYKFRKRKLRFGGVKLTDTENQCKHMKEVINLRNVLVDGGFIDG